MILLIPLFSCQIVTDPKEKVRVYDEFLVIKNPLVLPPDFNISQNPRTLKMFREQTIEEINDILSTTKDNSSDIIQMFHQIIHQQRTLFWIK